MAPNLQRESNGRILPKHKRSLIPKAPATSWFALIFLWLVYAMNGIDREIMNRVMPAIVGEYHIDAASIGLIASVIMIATSFLAMPGAKWADAGGHGWARKYRHLPVAAAYTLLSVLTGSHLLTATLGGFLILQVLKNAFGGLGEAIEVTTVAEWWPEEHRGFAQGAHHSGYPWGSLFGGAITALILSAFGTENWRMTFLLVPLFMIPIFFAYWFFATPKNFNKFQKKSEEMGLEANIAEDVDVATRKAPEGAMGRALKNPNILVAGFGSFMGMCAYAGLGFWLAPYLSFVGNMSIAAAAGWSVFFTITGGVGQIFWGTISDRIGRKRALLITFIWLAVGMYLMRYSVNGLGYLIGIQLFAGMATNAIFPLLYSLASDSSEHGAMGIANSITLVGMYVGGIAPYILGVFINLGGGWKSASGYGYGSWFLTGCCLLSALVIFLFARETRGPGKGRDFSLSSLEKCNIKMD